MSTEAARRFDPYAILAALERERVYYIVVGALARVIVGADETTPGIDITPSATEENLRRLDHALSSISARRRDGTPPALDQVDYQHEPVVELQTDCGQVKVVPYPAGSRGYDDLRRNAERQPIGRGLRPSVASPADLARMLNALGREEDRPKLRSLRRLIEIEHELHRGRSIER